MNESANSDAANERVGDPPLSRSERRRRSECAILAAAREEFGARGFERATIRSVAARAGVDPALVMQHFRSKEALFAAAAHVDVRAEHVLQAAGDELPAAVLRDLFAQFGQPDARAAAVALMRNCLTHPQATAMMRNEVAADAMRDTVSQIGGDDPELRAALFNATIMGLVLARYVIEVEPLASACESDVARLLVPALAALAGTANPKTAPRSDQR